MGGKAGRLTGKRQSLQAGSSLPCSSPCLVQGTTARQRAGYSSQARAPGQHFRFRPYASRGEAAATAITTVGSCSGPPPPLPRPYLGLVPARVGQALSPAPNGGHPTSFLSPRALGGVAQGGTWVTGSGNCERRRPGHRGPWRRRGRGDARMGKAGHWAAHRRQTRTHGFCRARAVRNRLASRGAGT